MRSILYSKPTIIIFLTILISILLHPTAIFAQDPQIIDNKKTLNFDEASNKLFLAPPYQITRGQKHPFGYRQTIIPKLIPVDFALFGSTKTTPASQIILYLHGISVGVEGTIFRESDILFSKKMGALLPARPGYGDSRFLGTEKIKLETPNSCANRIHELLKQLIENKQISNNAKVAIVATSAGGMCALAFANKSKYTNVRGQYQVKALVLQAAFSHAWVTRSLITDPFAIIYPDLKRISNLFSGGCISAFDKCAEKKLKEIREALDSIQSNADIFGNNKFERVSVFLEKIFDSIKLYYLSPKVSAVSAELRRSLTRLKRSNSTKRTFERAKRRIFVNSKALAKLVVLSTKARHRRLELARYSPHLLRNSYGYMTFGEGFFRNHVPGTRLQYSGLGSETLWLITVREHLNLFLKQLEASKLSQACYATPGSDFRTELENSIKSDLDLSSLPSGLFAVFFDTPILLYRCSEKVYHGEKRKICQHTCLTRMCIAHGMLIEAAKGNAIVTAEKSKFLASVAGAAGLVQAGFSGTEIKTLLGDSNTQAFGKIFHECAAERPSTTKCVLLNSISIMHKIGAEPLVYKNDQGREIDGISHAGGLTGLKDEFAFKVSKIPTLIIHDPADSLVPFEHSMYLWSDVFSYNKNVSMVCPKTVGHFIWTGRDASGMNTARKAFLNCNLSGDSASCGTFKSTINTINADAINGSRWSDGEISRLAVDSPIFELAREGVFGNYCMHHSSPLAQSRPAIEVGVKKTQKLRFASVRRELMSQQEISKSLEFANQIVRSSSDRKDVACNMVLEIDGKPTVLSPNFRRRLKRSVIKNRGDLNAAWRLKADVIIVSAIGYCGKYGTFSGCQKGTKMIVTANFHPSTLAHEFGHRVGLRHYDSDDKNIMYYRKKIDRVRLTQKQCNRFRR